MRRSCSSWRDVLCVAVSFGSYWDWAT